MSEIPLANSDRNAVAEADVVLSVNSPIVALNVATRVAPFLKKGRLFADLNTSSPRLKESIAQVVEANGALFVDVALMAPVPGRGLRTPVLVSGSGAEQFEKIFAPLGMPVKSLGTQPGAAIQRKLLRSVFMKGMAAVVIESLSSAERAGQREWMWQEIVSVFNEANESLMHRLIEGSHKHAVRRVEEMRAAAELLRELNTPPRVTIAAQEWLDDLSKKQSLNG
jgi:3-hydroxyisobutyrate dehydrogenase-like beta-hydroxyacid dehydrogenase